VTDDLGQAFRGDYGRLVARSRRMLDSPEDAEDCVQDAFVAALERGRADEPDLADPGAWLSVVSRRRAVDHVRRRVRERAAMPRLAARIDAVEASATDDRVLDAIEAEQLVTTLHGLPPTTQRVVDLVGKGATTGETAAVLGLTARSVESHVQRARRFLRRQRTPWLAGLALLAVAMRRGLTGLKAVAVPVALVTATVLVLPRLRSPAAVPRSHRAPAAPAHHPRHRAPPIPRPRTRPPMPPAKVGPTATTTTPEPSLRASLAPTVVTRNAAARPSASTTTVAAAQVGPQGAVVYQQPNDAPSDPAGLARYCLDHLVVTTNHQGCG